MIVNSTQTSMALSTKTDQLLGEPAPKRRDDKRRRKNDGLTDIYSPERRSEIMGRVKSRDTKPELVVRSLIHHLGFRYRLHAPDLPGRPDIVMSRLRKVVFVNGCFWHRHVGCPRSKLPHTRRAWWKDKLTRNFKRDIETQKQLQIEGWNVLVVWQCQIQDLSQLEKSLREFLNCKQ